jgi:signal transduction histidine kinase
MYLRQLFCPNLAESAAVLLTVVCLLLLRAYRQKQKFNCLLRVRQAEIVRQYEELSRLNQQKDRFLSLISHDVRGPLNSIHGVLLLVQAKALPADQVQMLLGKLAGEVQHTSLLLDNLLKWTASQMHGMHVQPTRVDLRRLALENVALYEHWAERKTVALQCTLPDPLLVTADEEMARTVVRNLLNNAIKFTHPGGTVTLRAERRFFGAAAEGHPAGAWVQFTVQDTGVGMAPEIVVRLFSGAACSTPGTTGEVGTGIGLRMCHDFIEQHGGRLWVESCPGCGTRFHFTLPAVQETLDTSWETRVPNLPDHV